MRTFILLIALMAEAAVAVHAREFHVGPNQVFKTLGAAAELAGPGDVITVHAGVYRERVDPPRGGTSDGRRIVYQAARGEKVTLTGSENVRGWVWVTNDTWKVTLPEAFFGVFNPYRDRIHGDWFAPKGRPHHTGAVYVNGHWLIEAARLDEVLRPPGDQAVWFADSAAVPAGASQSTPAHTAIWAQFRGLDPNLDGIEINVRQSVFYPSQPGRDYITVRGFTLEHAATPWAPPTAEQVGLIGTHWSKGWIIEDNVIRYSKCSGVAFGKHGDAFDNTSADTAEGYVETIKRAHAHGWSRANIGHHVVRNNHISHCEQAGVVGSMGCAFSTVTGNDIHDIHVHRLFSGAEMGGIKFHGAVDVTISHNHIHRVGGVAGLWLDWMAQGTRVASNLFHDNSQDLFLEVNHGPFLVDNNLFLSKRALDVQSDGGAFAHNLIAGSITTRPETNRVTPYLKPHATEVVGLRHTPVGDVRWYNNLLTGDARLGGYDAATGPVQAQGNLFLGDASASRHEVAPALEPGFDPHLRLAESRDGWFLTLTLNPAWGTTGHRTRVTTASLGRAGTLQLPFENADGSALDVNRDYLGRRRDGHNPFPGPFENAPGGAAGVKVWPVPHVQGEP